MQVKPDPDGGGVGNMSEGIENSREIRDKNRLTALWVDIKIASSILTPLGNPTSQAEIGSL